MGAEDAEELGKRRPPWPVYEFDSHPPWGSGNRCSPPSKIDREIGGFRPIA